MLKWYEKPYIALNNHNLILFITCFIVFDVVSKQIHEYEQKTVYNILLKGLQNHSMASSGNDQKPLDAVRQPVDNTRLAFYVYSAFVERRKRPAVRVIGVTKINTEDRVYCILRLPDNRTYIASAEVQTLAEHHDMYYGAVFILCFLKNIKPDETIGGSVSVLSSTSRKRIASNLLKIMDTSPKNFGQENIHVCVRPLHDSYNDVEWMVEWIELNQIFGVSHFYFYNMSVGAKIDCMLRNYPKNKELFTILPFEFSDLKLWAEGQKATSQDCLYRSASRADWLLLIDLDEVVIPHDKGIQLLRKNQGKHVKLYPKLFSLLPRRESADLELDPYAFQFTNAFFYQGWKDDPKSNVSLLTARKTRRSISEPWFGIYRPRSKYAVRPSKAVELGIHYVEEFESHDTSYNTFQVDPEVALLHHYRSQCAQPACYRRHAVIDRSAHRWTEPLWKRVQETLGEIYQVCPKIDMMETV